jgi:hypothetical protein
MPGEFDFDMEAAGAAISADLGFGEGSSADDGDIVVDLSPDDVKAAEVAAAPAAAPTSAPAPAPTPAAPAPAADTSLEPPKTWRKEAAAEWAALSPTVRAEIAKREQDIFSGLESYKTDASFGKSVQSVLQPYLPTLRQHGIDPLQQISGLMQAHYNLVTGSPETKIQYLSKIAQDYGVALDQLQPAGDQLYVDPAVKDLQSKFNALQSERAAEFQARAAAEQATLVKEIEAFSLDPKNPYFKDVANDMVRLLEAKAAKTLQEAYEQAIWINPSIRSKEIARQQAEATTKAAAEETARAEAARKATAVNVKTKAKSAGAAAPLGSIDDTLAETLAAIKARA